MINNKIINSIEALLFGAGRPLRLSEIKGLLEMDLGQLELSSIKIAVSYTHLTLPTSDLV